MDELDASATHSSTHERSNDVEGRKERTKERTDVERTWKTRRETRRQATIEMAESVVVKRCDGDRAFKRRVCEAIATSFANANDMTMLGEHIHARLRSRATNVVIGKGDFHALARYATRRLAYAHARGALGKGTVMTYRVLVFDTLSDGRGVEEGERTLERACGRSADEDAGAGAGAGKKRGRAAAAIGDVSGVPRPIVDCALGVLNDDALGDDDDVERRMTALREALTKKFGSFWHVISDEEDFAVASRATELPRADSKDASKTKILLRFKRGKRTYCVWHHVAPFDRFGWNKLTWAEKVKYARYALLVVAGLAVAYYRSKCGEIVEGRVLCRALPALAPVAAGLFIFLVVSAHVDTRIWNSRAKQS